MSQTQLVGVAKSVGKVVLAAVLTGLSAYATGHQAENPALYGAIIIAIVEVTQALERRGDLPAPTPPPPVAVLPPPSSTTSGAPPAA